MREMYIPQEQVVISQRIPVQIEGNFELTVKPNTGYSEERNIFMAEGTQEISSTTPDLEKDIKLSPREVKPKNAREKAAKKDSKEKEDINTKFITDQIREREQQIADRQMKADLKDLYLELSKKPFTSWQEQDFQREIGKWFRRSYGNDSASEQLRVNVTRLFMEVAEQQGYSTEKILSNIVTGAELKTMPAELLKKEYSEAVRFSLEQEHRGESTQVVQPYTAMLIDEMRVRNIDIGPLRAGLLKKYAKPGERFSGGAQSAPERSTDFNPDSVVGDELLKKHVRTARDYIAGNSGTDRNLSDVIKRMEDNSDQGRYIDPDQAQEFIDRLIQERENVRRLDKAEQIEAQVQSRNKQVVVEREGWNYTPNEQALARAEAAHLFTPQVAAIRDIWRAIEAADRIADPAARQEAMKRAFSQDDVKRLRGQLDDATVPDENIDRFYDIQGLLNYEFNRMTNRVEGNKFSEHEAHPEEIEFVRRIYRELDDIPDDVEHEEQRDQLFTQLEIMLKREVDFASGRLTQQSRILDVIAEESLAKNREGRAHYGLALEFAVEQIIGRGDDNVTADYPQFGFYEGNNLEEMIQGARRLDQGFAMYLTNLKGKRAMAHELFKNMKDRQTFVGIVAKGLDPGSMRFIEKEVGGISEVQMLFEKEYARMAAMNSYEGKGWILHDQFKNEVDVNVERWVNSGDFDLRKQVRRWRLDRSRGEYVPEPVQGVTRKMRPWEIRRAKNMGRSVSAVALRRQYYGVIGDTPNRISERVETVEGGEEIMMLASPIKLINERYFAFQPGSKMFLDTWCDRKVAEASGSGKRYSVTRRRRNGGEESKGIFGTTERSNILMDSGTVDIKSSMWRADKMFFDQPDYANIEVDGDQFTIGEYFFNTYTRIEHEVEHEPAFARRPHHDIAHEAEHRFNHEIHRVLSEQRLSLGIISMFGKLDDSSRTILWEKAAQLLPSRMAMLMPQFSMDEVKAVYGDNEQGAKNAWNEIIRKLAVVEFDRVQDDAIGFKVDQRTGARIRPDYVPRDLDAYIRARPDMDFDDRELEVIRRWQGLGHEMSPQLAQMIWPMAPFLDDVPQTDWEKMGRDEMKRLLVNDHNDWGEAYKGITGLIANPATAHPEKAMEAVKEIFHAFVENAKSPTSLSEAQDRVDAFVYTWGKMAQKYKSAKWTYDIAGVFRHPTSKMEEFNLSCGISYDEEEMVKYLASLANAEIISDDPIHAGKNNLTQFWRLTHELDADRKALILMYMRMLLLIFPLGVVAMMFKGIVPDELLGKH